MLFYFLNNPPTCTVAIETIESLILKRFRSYSASEVLQNETEEFDERDRISHLFMLLIVIEYPEFKDAFMEGEINILKQRLKVEESSVIRQSLSKALSYLRYLVQSQAYGILKEGFEKKLELVRDILQTLLSKSSHSFSKFHQKDCSKYKLIVPFQFVLDLVAKREVELRLGKASLPCGQWDEVLKGVSQVFLEIELKILENSTELRKILFESEDDRIRQIVRRFKNIVRGGFNKNGEIMASEIDAKSAYFPPCMANLHQVLRSTHRLSYYSRYQYSLFLRDIGVPVEENLMFWENEYRKPHENSTCTHDWERNQRRYTFQIEHLYGLNGSHKIKSSHSCQKFIKELEGRMDGGCPFQHLTLEELKKALPKSVRELPDLEDIFINKNNGFPQKACAIYLNCLQKVMKQKKTVLNESVDFNNCLYVVSPLQFFNIARNF